MSSPQESFWRCNSARVSFISVADGRLLGEPAGQGRLVHAEEGGGAGDVPAHAIEGIEDLVIRDFA